MISVVIPTITGREESLQRTLNAYEEHSPKNVDIIVTQDAPTWPDGCNAGYEQAKGDIIHWGADDLVPLPGWHKRVVKMLRSGENVLPNARVWDYVPEGTPSNVNDGADLAPTLFTRVPIMRREQAEQIGTWPSIIYYGDCWVSERGRTLGIPTINVFGYDFVHHWCQIGRVDSKENMDKAGNDLAALIGRRFG